MIPMEVEDSTEPEYQREPDGNWGLTSPKKGAWEGYEASPGWVIGEILLLRPVVVDGMKHL